MGEFLKQIGLPNLSVEAVHYLVRLGITLLLFLFGLWLAARLANLIRRGMQRAQVETTLVVFLRNLSYGFMVAIISVAALTRVGVPSASLITALGAAGLAIGLALQGSLSNLAWGVLLAVFRPFRVGDWVEIGGEIDGKVENINLMHTELVLADNRIAVLPNSKVGSATIINFNRRNTRRIEQLVGIAYEADTARAITVLQQIVQYDPRVLSEPTPQVYVTELADSSVNLNLRAWVATEDFWSIKMELLQRIKQALDTAGIGIPYPQREVHHHYPDKSPV